MANRRTHHMRLELSSGCETAAKWRGLGCCSATGSTAWRLYSATRKWG